MQRLVTVIRQDLEPGYQIAQSIHSAVEYALNYTGQMAEWNFDSNYVLVLGTDNESTLEQFVLKLDLITPDYRVFYEPDIDQETSVTFLSSDETDLLTQNMPLAGEVSGKINKDYKGNL